MKIILDGLYLLALGGFLLLGTTLFVVRELLPLLK